MRTVSDRDLTGYGAVAPHPHWPGDARVALQFVLNFEEGAERNVALGDDGSENFLSDMVGAASHPGHRSPAMESLYEYGSRAGFWRLYRLFKERGIPVTVFGVTTALALNPEAVDAMQSADWEIACHGLRWIDQQNAQSEIEKRQIEQAIALHTKITGTRPLGWYQGRTSEQTARLICEEGGFIYDADSYADDLPYYNYSYGKSQLIVPYALDTNDMKFVALNGFTDGHQFFTYLKDCFDFLYAEGEHAPKMMSVGLHGRIAGRPARASAVARFIDYVLKHDKVWCCKRIDIAQHWLKEHPPCSV